ncbi:UNVERIFIED_CONTAM: hypothetical protein Sradi_4023200 [Sesamum radiatum]|uniref:Uncharacterized protein n=1 Tax=Sesamum radiatum TaxID=300843 RepID=A0AAW2PL15_SESRA
MVQPSVPIAAAIVPVLVGMENTNVADTFWQPPRVLGIASGPPMQVSSAPQPSDIGDGVPPASPSPTL